MFFYLSGKKKTHTHTNRYLERLFGEKILPTIRTFVIMLLSYFPSLQSKRNVTTNITIMKREVERQIMSLSYGRGKKTLKGVR